MDYSSKVLIFF